MTWKMNYPWMCLISGVVPCLAAFLPAAAGSPHIIDVDQGTPFSPWVRGQCPYRWIRADGVYYEDDYEAYEALWELTRGAMGRGVAGGLDADTYDWRDINSGCWYGLLGGKFTTLEFLQYARDYDAVPMITANMFGGGYLDEDDAFVCVTDNPDGLAADWIRYTNIILPNYRQGDEASLTGEDLRVYNSISDWDGRPKLLAPGEEIPPRVDYWEIGNEPEVGDIAGHHIDHYLSPSEYRDRYKLMAPAMLAVDPTIKIGPCLTNPAIPSYQWLPVLAADPDAPIDFVSYHPYDGALVDVWGDTDAMTAALRNVKPKLLSKSAATRSIMDQAGRSGYELIASEWNPVSWSGTSVMQSSMANALGIVESCFTFAEDGMLAATFWQEPQKRLGPTGAFTGLVNDMGDVLVTTSAQLGYDDDTTDFRIYISKNSDDDSKVMIWGLNFTNSSPITINLGLPPRCECISATLKNYGKAGGGTTLTTYTDMVWSQQDVTAGFNPTDFPFTMQPAEITVLVLEATCPKVVLYVDASATGAGDGTSWADAYTDIQDALAAAVYGDDIWVAAGTYKPTTTTDRTISFAMPDGVAIYGGFTGNEDPNTFDLADRDFEANETILSGDIGVPGDNSDNSYHVVVGANNGTLDGFTITGGNANGPSTSRHGGGMYNASVSPTVANCRFMNNSATGEYSGGGGMYNKSSNPTVTYCTFLKNLAFSGGGMDNSNSSPKVIICTFEGNSAEVGGGIANWSSISSTVSDCTFSGNTAAFRGGGMFNLDSSLKLTNCTFTGNASADYGGGMYNEDSNPTITNCTFTANAGSAGGAVFNYTSHPVITNCILWGNTGWQIQNIYQSNPTVTYSCVQDGWEGEGNIDVDPLLLPLMNYGGPTWTHAIPLDSPAYAIPESAGGGNWNGAPDTDQRGMPRATTGYRAMGAFEGDLYVGRTVIFVDALASGGDNGTSWADAFIDLQDALAATAYHDEIWVAKGTYTPTAGSGRSASFVMRYGVAIYGGFAGNEDPATFDLADRDFQANETILSGDIGVPADTTDNSYHVITGTDDATLDGFTITGGNASGSTASEQSGGGIYNDATSPTVSNCTFTANEASVGGGGMYNDAAGPTVTHCTFASNSAATNGGGMYNNNAANPTVTDCTFVGNAALSGGGMANASSGPAVTNCTFSNNAASRDGGAFFNLRSSPTITNCTFAGNSATNNGGGMFNFASSPVIANCILWDNVGGQLYNASSTPTVTYSCIQGGYTGEGNIDIDPLLSPLADNGGPTWTHALASNSPAYTIPESAGGGNWNGAPDTDQRGQPRATTGYRAMGAFEDEYIAPPPVVTSAASVKNHGPAGDLGIAILLSGGSVECRLGGPTRLVVMFDQDIYGSGGLPVDDVTLSAGTVEAVTIAGNVMTVDIAGVPDATVLTATFPGIESDAGQPCADTLCVRVLAGDVNGDGEVGIFDLVAMRDNTGQPVTEADCPCDMNSDGAINIFDLVNVRDQTGATVGTCP